MKSLKPIFFLFILLSLAAVQGYGEGGNDAFDPASPESVKNAVSALGSADWSERLKLEEELAQWKGMDAVETIIELLRSGDDQKRIDAAGALAVIKDERALDSLVEVLDDDNKRLRHGAVWAITQLDRAEALEPVSRLIDDPHAPIRKAVAHYLGTAHEKAGIPALIKALEDSDTGVLLTAMSSLLLIKDAQGRFPPGQEKEALTKLEKLKRHEQETIQRQAEKTMEWLQTVPVTPGHDYAEGSPEAFYEDFRKALLAAEEVPAIEKHLSSEGVEFMENASHGMTGFQRVRRFAEIENYEFSEVTVEGNIAQLTREMHSRTRTVPSRVTLRREDGRWKFVSESLSS